MQWKTVEYRLDTLINDINKTEVRPPSKNGHKKASKNEMNRSISLIY